MTLFRWSFQTKTEQKRVDLMYIIKCSQLKSVYHLHNFGTAHPLINAMNDVRVNL